MFSLILSHFSQICLSLKSEVHLNHFETLIPVIEKFKVHFCLSIQDVSLLIEVRGTGKHIAFITRCEKYLSLIFFRSLGASKPSLQCRETIQVLDFVILNLT